MSRSVTIAVMNGYQHIEPWNSHGDYAMHLLLCVTLRTKTCHTRQGAPLMHWLPSDFGKLSFFPRVHYFRHYKERCGYSGWIGRGVLCFTSMTATEYEQLCTVVQTEHVNRGSQMYMYMYGGRKERFKGYFSPSVKTTAKYSRAQNYYFNTIQ